LARGTIAEEGVGEKENAEESGGGGWEGARGSGRRALLGGIETHALAVDETWNRPTSQMVGSIENSVSSVARKRERERKRDRID